MASATRGGTRRDRLAGVLRFPAKGRPRPFRGGPSDSTKGVSRGSDPAGRSRPASPGLCPGALPHHGRVFQLRHQFHDHLDPDRCGDPLRLRARLGRTRRQHPRLAARLDLHLADRGIHGRDRIGLPHGRRSVLLVEPDEEQGLGLVDRLVQSGRPGRDRRRHRLRRGFVRQLGDRHADSLELQPRLRQQFHVPRHAGERPASDHGRAACHSAGPEHCGHSDRGPIERRLGLVAHRDGSRDRCGALPDQLRQGPLDPEPVCDRSSGHHRRRIGLRRSAQSRARGRVCAAVRVPVLATAGAVDVHRL